MKLGNKSFQKQKASTRNQTSQDVFEVLGGLYKDVIIQVAAVQNDVVLADACLVGGEIFRHVGDKDTRPIPILRAV